MINFTERVWWCPVCKKRRTVRWSPNGNRRIVRCCNRKFEITTQMRERIAYEAMIIDVEDK